MISCAHKISCAVWMSYAILRNSPKLHEITLNILKMMRFNGNEFHTERSQKSQLRGPLAETEI